MRGEISKREPFRALVAAARAAEEADPEAGEPLLAQGARRLKPPRRGARRPPPLPPRRGTEWNLPRIVTDVHRRSHADGRSLIRPSVPSVVSRIAQLALEETVPRFRRPVRAREVFRRAVAHYQAGAIFDARTDALLAAVYDPDNPVYRRAAERWSAELRRAADQARWKS